ncbi:DUF7512 family protein [Natrinema halophilum]|uniref:Uncharacterized protein n=1 Tax=Natrinema halophilum TaxID=1699371 RepID=A0A7D5L397_9EURY|nr:hypothetical protein [Natrinema halophilum]QLG48385.1 hypothetical protein HYG82_05745 [Natrinema halophilum]
MIGSFATAADAAVLIGIVLLEAIVLYVGYGAAEEALAEPIVKRITNV